MGITLGLLVSSLIVIHARPQDTQQERDETLVLLIIDGVFYTAGYFFLINCVLGLIITWMDPTTSNPKTSRYARFFRCLHLGILGGAVLVIWGGITVATVNFNPQTAEEGQKVLNQLDKSKKLRTLGTSLVLVTVVTLLLNIAVRLVRNPTRQATYLLVVTFFLTLRTSLSYYFIYGTSGIADDVHLYGLGVAPELPVLILLCIPPFVAWFKPAVAQSFASVLPQRWRRRFEFLSGGRREGTFPEPQVEYVEAKRSLEA
ncbi:uncharacterized protein SPPG_09563 [Spizellomyces punctatus DAOM BR117]|uniref:THH1/TOM1/TOM3 domain-containing protein n=1 Tax=Spizellomyces punctatus (strain DAOM BR117) TaxID=645134 RepID=A0A0L0H5N7_SPIPD|nr:uncharacterized protein SPPG_09563 [Spizellomyces punctatus DAOM BR117]KNC96028.1 hypothetical protein SPPG_09563 [Spizellomyces punctatus DAOM BR117]|eukprot:XP_016604068.1 hypothetical protein SPPG_09563 [Spizellomyces punctatus DAOM BR117]